MVSVFTWLHSGQVIVESRIISFTIIFYPPLDMKDSPRFP